MKGTAFRRSATAKNVDAGLAAEARPSSYPNARIILPDWEVSAIDKHVSVIRLLAIYCDVISGGLDVE